MNPDEVKYIRDPDIVVSLLTEEDRTQIALGTRNEYFLDIVEVTFDESAHFYSSPLLSYRVAARNPADVIATLYKLVEDKLHQQFVRQDYINFYARVCSDEGCHGYYRWTDLRIVKVGDYGIP